jgi:hypothetical protein
VRSLKLGSYGGSSITEKGDDDYQEIHHKEASV